MTTQFLAGFPTAPSGKEAWPWRAADTKETSPTERGQNLPRLSIITTSYNQGQYLEETIRSVLLQNYSNLEYIVIDGKSADNSVSILNRYSDWITYWISESDKGQSNAINKGLQKASGDIVAWISSDDCYAPNTFHRVAAAMLDTDADLVMGDAIANEQRENQLVRWRLRTPEKLNLLFHYRLWNTRFQTMPCQPAVFIRRSVIDELGPFREDLYYAMDYEYWLRAIFAGRMFLHIPEVFAFYRFHEASKSGHGFARFLPEWESVSRTYFRKISVREKITASNWLRASLRQHRKEEKNNEVGALLSTLSPDSEDPRKNSVIEQLLRVLVSKPYLIGNRMFIGAIKAELKKKYGAPISS